MSQHDDQGNDKSRRNFLKIAAGAAAAAAVVGVLPRAAHAADLPHLTSADPTAKALGYVDDATKSTNPKYKPGDTCANCSFYQGKAGDAYGPCQLFPGKAVHSKGWCLSHQVKKA